MTRSEQRGLLVPRLETWRRVGTLTQQELAARAKVARSTIVRAEGGGAISLANVRKIAEALGISVRQLLYSDPSESKARGAA